MSSLALLVENQYYRSTLFSLSVPSIQRTGMSTKAKNTCVAEAYRKYFRIWCNLAKSVKLSDDEAKDIVHAVLASLLENPEREFESAVHVRNYVARGVLNRALSSRQRAVKSEVWTLPVELEHAVLTDEERSDEELRARVFKEALLSLSKNDFEIIKLRFFSGFEFGEMSQMLNRPISTLKSREEAAIKRIRAYVRKKGV
jgi:RNA polymerase sigma factor (sigma-70 family)